MSDGAVTERTVSHDSLDGLELDDGNLKATDTEGGCTSRLPRLVGATLHNRYFHANALYVAYSAGMLVIDFGGFSTRTNYHLYYFFNLVHLVNACMYVWTWKGRSWYDPVVYPEYVNVMGGLLYSASSCFYSREEGNFGSYTSIVHIIESVAATLEVLACVGWTWSWHATYLRVPGRGYTLEDPDVWALASIYVAAVVYWFYNLENLIWPGTYMTNRLYVTGDVLYFANSLLYMVAALRDDGWWYFMPHLFSHGHGTPNKGHKRGSSATPLFLLCTKMPASTELAHKTYNTLPRAPPAHDMVVKRVQELGEDGLEDHV